MIRGIFIGSAQGSAQGIIARSCMCTFIKQELIPNKFAHAIYAHEHAGNRCSNHKLYGNNKRSAFNLSVNITGKYQGKHAYKPNYAATRNKQVGNTAHAGVYQRA